MTGLEFETRAIARYATCGWPSLTSCLPERGDGLLRQQHVVDDVDHAVRLLDVGDGDGGDAFALVVQYDLVALHHGDEGAAGDGLDGVLAAVVLDHLLDHVGH